MNMKGEMVFQLKVFLCFVTVATADSAKDFTKTTKYSSITSNTPFGYPPLLYSYSIHPTITTYSNGQVETDFGDVPHRIFSANQDCPNCQNNVPEVRIGAHTKYSRHKAGKSLQLPTQLTNYVPVTKDNSISSFTVPVLPVEPEKILSNPIDKVDSTINITPSSDASSSATADIYKNDDQTSFTSYLSNTNPALDSRFSEKLPNTAQTRPGYPVSKFTITYIPVPPVGNPLRYDKNVINNQHIINSNKDIPESSKPEYYYNVETFKSDGGYHSGPQVFSNPNFLANTAIPFFQNSYVTPTTDSDSSKNAYTQSTTSIYPSISMQFLAKHQNVQTSTPVTDDSVIASAKSTEYVSPSQSFPSYSSALDDSNASYNSQQVSYNW